jgi:hypothetical protein
VAMPPTRRIKRRSKAPAVDAGAAFVRLMNSRLTNRDQRSHAEFLHDMRARQAAGQLSNPATAALLDRLERVLR